MSVLVALALFGVGLVALSLIEYVHHWHGGHRGILGKRLLASHLAHHRDPLEGGVTYGEKVKQRMPLVVGVSVGMGLPLYAATNAFIASSIMSGIIFGYFYSEWFHHAIHHRAPRNRFERFMWRYHYIHHFKSIPSNIGFTSPVWDVVFRTGRTDPTVSVPEQRVAAFAAQVPGVEVHPMRRG